MPSASSFFVNASQVFDLEADVIDRSAGGADGRRRRRREVQEHAGQVVLHERGSRIGRKHRRAERLCVPRLHLGVHLPEEVDVMKLNRGLLRFDFDELYFDILRTERKRDVRRRTGGRNVVGHLHVRGDRIGSDHFEAVRLDLRHHRLEIGNGKADVIHRRADRAARRRLHRTEKDQNIRELDDLLLPVTGTDLDHAAAERVGIEFLLRGHVRGVQMVVPIHDRTFSGNQNLRTGNGRHEQQRWLARFRWINVS